MGKYFGSHFYCTQCGNEGIPVQRKQGQERSGGHLKKLYCIYCKEEVNHVEIKENDSYTYEDFREEYELGRFKEGNRENINDVAEVNVHLIKMVNVGMLTIHMIVLIDQK